MSVKMIMMLDRVQELAERAATAELGMSDLTVRNAELEMNCNDLTERLARKEREIRELGDRIIEGGKQNRSLIQTAQDLRKELHEVKRRIHMSKLTWNDEQQCYDYLNMSEDAAKPDETATEVQQRMSGYTGENWNPDEAAKILKGA